MKLTIKDKNGQDAGELTVNFPIVEGGRGTQAVHDVVVAYRAAQRSGTASTKTMGEVAGSGKKPWRQKGTGRARAGSFASPLWRGGGVVFGPKPRDFSKKVTKRTRQLALRKALTERMSAGDVVVVDDLTLSAPKTREFVQMLKAVAGGTSALVVAEKENRNLTLASRNVPGIELVSPEQVNTYQMLRYGKVLFTRAAFEKVDQRLSAK